MGQRAISWSLRGQQSRPIMNFRKSCALAFLNLLGPLQCSFFSMFREAVSVPLDQRETQFQLAAVKCHMESLRYFSRFDDINFGQNSSIALRNAVRTGNHECVELILGLPGIHTTDSNFEAYDIAVRSGDVRMVQILMSRNSWRMKIPNALNRKLIVHTIEHDHCNMLKYLFSHAKAFKAVESDKNSKKLAKENPDQHYLLQLGCQSGATRSVLFLQRYLRESINTKCLISAMVEGRSEFVKEFLPHHLGHICRDEVGSNMEIKEDATAKHVNCVTELIKLVIASGHFDVVMDILYFYSDESEDELATIAAMDYIQLGNWKATGKIAETYDILEKLAMKLLETTEGDSLDLIETALQKLNGTISKSLAEYVFFAAILKDNDKLAALLFKTNQAFLDLQVSLGFAVRTGSKKIVKLILAQPAVFVSDSLLEKAMNLNNEEIARDIYQHHTFQHSEKSLVKAQEYAIGYTSTLRNTAIQPQDYQNQLTEFCKNWRVPLHRVLSAEIIESLMAEYTDPIDITERIIVNMMFDNHSTLVPNYDRTFGLTTSQYVLSLMYIRKLADSFLAIYGNSLYAEHVDSINNFKQSLEDMIEVSTIVDDRLPPETVFEKVYEHLYRKDEIVTLQVPLDGTGMSFEDIFARPGILLTLDNKERTYTLQAIVTTSNGDKLVSMKKSRIGAKLVATTIAPFIRQLHFKDTQRYTLREIIDQLFPWDDPTKSALKSDTVLSTDLKDKIRNMSQSVYQMALSGASNMSILDWTLSLSGKYDSIKAALEKFVVSKLEKRDSVTLSIIGTGHIAAGIYTLNPGKKNTGEWKVFNTGFGASTADDGRLHRYESFKNIQLRTLCKRLSDGSRTKTKTESQFREIFYPENFITHLGISNKTLSQDTSSGQKSGSCSLKSTAAIAKHILGPSLYLAFREFEVLSVLQPIYDRMTHLDTLESRLGQIPVPLHPLQLPRSSHMPPTWTYTFKHSTFERSFKRRIVAMSQADDQSPADRAALKIAHDMAIHFDERYIEWRDEIYMP